MCKFWYKFETKSTNRVLSVQYRSLALSNTLRAFKAPGRVAAARPRAALKNGT